MVCVPERYIIDLKEDKMLGMLTSASKNVGKTPEKTQVSLPDTEEGSSTDCKAMLR